MATLSVLNLDHLFEFTVDGLVILDCLLDIKKHKPPTTHYHKMPHTNNFTKSNTRTRVLKVETPRVFCNIKTHLVLFTTAVKRIYGEA